MSDERIVIPELPDIPKSFGLVFRNAALAMCLFMAGVALYYLWKSDRESQSINSQLQNLLAGLQERMGTPVTTFNGHGPVGAMADASKPVHESPYSYGASSAPSPATEPTATETGE